MEKIILLIPGIPIVIAFLLIFVKKKEFIPKISLILSSMIALLGLYGAYYVISNDTQITGFGGLLIYNQLSAVLVPYVAILGLVIRKYATKYMWDEAGYKRFFILLNFIFASIYLLVMSNNLIVLALAWQLMSIGLYLLVSFNVGSKTAVKNARWTMYIHKGADLVFLLAVILTYKTFQSLDLATLSEKWLLMSKGPVEDPVIFVIGLLFLIAAMMKSAIVPFHIWLPYTSEAPTPVSGLMHAGVVNVGGILLNKLAYLLMLTPGVLNIAFGVGLFTAIFASALMLVVSDIKRSLGYSTVGQMGYMIMEIGLGAFSLAIYHLIVHGIFKATLFLESGALIKYARHDPNIPERLSYKVFWEDKTGNRSNRLFYLIAIFTILPVLAFIGVKMVLSEEFFEFNAAIVILAFAWLTGTQLFLSFFKVSKSDSIQVILALVSTFVLILFTYEFIGLTLEHFLYGEDALLFYKAATLNVTMASSMVMLAVIMTIGWLFMYKQHFVEIPNADIKPNKMKWLFYKLLAKEGFYFEIFKRSKKGRL
ncbi:proton-conducting transporter transmembrane domain-containing protein [Sulfurimonas hydrogeniphila]|uniref:proton-conducting transporter transmembrane domain-containing protein n=1 Tax=Sulfurimonas TaxID=202746 RepID=UPI00125F429B|nr:proton-conducting transporter membrane subunit [Sulfurimonas hydrogeniphila]